MTTSPVRVRMAPSPTGYFHVGSARTALFNWLFARQHNGVFVLRIEDTDALRNRPEHTEGIERAMRWLGLDWDEGPYFQSQRSHLYEKAIEQLLAAGHVYACDCTAEDVAARNKAANRPPGYDGHCRDRGLGPDLGRLLRFRTPDEGRTSWTDVIRGEVTYENAVIEDFSIRKSSGQPLFILANVVDDADMAISHVIRGEDHVPNTPKYLLLWEALGYGPVPTFAHLPLLVNASRQKLSKRRDKVALEDYRDEGYLPEAMVNYLALLGWSPKGDREVLATGELIDEFRLDEVKSSPAFFDLTKLIDVNATYLRGLSPEGLVARAQEWLAARWAPLAPLVQERARTLAEVYSMTDFMYVPEVAPAQDQWAKLRRQQPAFTQLLAAAEGALASCEWDAASIKEAVAEAGQTVGVGNLGKAQAPVRLAITGRTVGPPLFESLELLGRNRAVARISAARQRAEAEDKDGA
ncbi:MAG TPA: glutamate--tRNA ligase [Acidimicrobiales bacterium]|nr:glutamate--tRNA ligase [Acidimicrobiales bacterium]